MLSLGGIRRTHETFIKCMTSFQAYYRYSISDRYFGGGSGEKLKEVYRVSCFVVVFSPFYYVDKESISQYELE